MLNGRDASGEPVPLSTSVGPVSEVRVLVAQFAGIRMGEELRRVRAVGPAIAAIDWTGVDEGPPPPPPNDADAAE